MPRKYKRAKIAEESEASPKGVAPLHTKRREDNTNYKETENWKNTRQRKASEVNFSDPTEGSQLGAKRKRKASELNAAW